LASFAWFPYVLYLSGLPAPKSVFNTSKITAPGFTKLCPQPKRSLALSQKSERTSADQPVSAMAEFFTKVQVMARAQPVVVTNPPTPAAFGPTSFLKRDTRNPRPET
jgi:hypothetical protein